MTATVPRADLDTIATRHGVDYDLNTDPSIQWVRDMAAWLRCDLTGADRYEQRLIAEADDLDALADRYEKETR